MTVLQSNVYEGRCLRLEVWEESVDTAANASTVCWRLTSLGGTATYYYIADTTVTINGQQVYFYDAPAWDTNWAAKTFPVKTGQVEGQLTVPHNADGRKTLSVSLSTRVYLSTSPAVWGGTLTLTDIHQTQDTDFTAADMVLGENCCVTWTAQGELYYRLMFIVGSKFQSVWGIRPGRSGSYTYRSLPLAASLAQGIPNAPAGEMTVTLTAHRDYDCTEANQVGSAVTATCTVTVPATADFLPELAMALAPGGDLPEAFAGLYIQGKTALTADLTAQAKQGAAIQSWTLAAGNQSLSGSGPRIQLGSLTQYGSITVTGTVQDSRGHSVSASATIQVLPYTRPRILSASGQSRVVAARCDSAGILTDSGSYLVIRARRSYSPMVWGGQQRSFCTLAYRYKADTDTGWSGWVTLLAPEDASDEIATGPLLGTLQPDRSYQVQLRARDTLAEETVTTVTVSTQRVYCHRQGARGSFAFGKLAEEDDVFDLAPEKTLILRGKLRLSQEAAAAITDLAWPVGMVLYTRSPANPAETLGGVWTALSSPEEGTYRWERTQ